MGEMPQRLDDPAVWGVGQPSSGCLAQVALQGNWNSSELLSSEVLWEGFSNPGSFLGKRIA